MPVSYLATSMEMTDSEQLNPAPRHAEVSLTPTPGRSWVIKPLHDRVAGPAGWRSVNWSAEQWRRRLINPRVRYATILVGGQIAGLAEFESQPKAQVEITMFGFAPEYLVEEALASGLVDYAFTLATKVAWALPDAAGKLPQRVWVNLRSGAAELALDYSARGYTPVVPA